MTIHLPKDVERAIEAAVDSGRFSSADDAVSTAWRVFEQSKLGQKATGKTVKRTLSAPQKPEKSLTPAELDQYMLSIGLITQLPNPADDISDDDPDDQPVEIEGEPLSETIIRERR